jgi:hypothetical protein
MYKIREVYKPKKFLRKSEFDYYSLSKNGNYISSSKNREELKDVKELHEKYVEEPTYKVYKLGSGEFEILQKGNFRTDGMYYASIFSHVENSGRFGYVLPGRKFYKTLDEACKKLLEFEKIELREIKEPVECV